MRLEVSPAQSDREIFLAALQLADDEQRLAFLDRVCGGDAERRREVDRLLAADDGGSASPLDQAIEELSPAVTKAVDVPPSEHFDMTTFPQIDRYQLLEQIGEGGMGAVFKAQQTEPVKRMVALKLIKRGMGSREVIARFQTERQALAMMDHPNIARVFDGGATDSGQPFFVMELVQGIPITEFCDQKRMTPSSRLELFVGVCQAVQHAHQKGIIHRDLKPTNILVTEIDGKAIPSVDDKFAIASGINDSGDVVVLYGRDAWSRGAYVCNPILGLGAIDLDLAPSSWLYITNSPQTTLPQVIGRYEYSDGCFRATIDDSTSVVSVETETPLEFIDQSTGSMVEVSQVTDVTGSGEFCGTFNVLVPINKRQSTLQRRAFIYYNGAYQTLPQLSEGLLLLNEEGDVANDHTTYNDRGSILLKGSDQVLPIVDLLDPDNLITSSVESVGVYGLGPRINGFPQVIARLRILDGHNELAILNPIAN